MHPVAAAPSSFAHAGRRRTGAILLWVVLAGMPAPAAAQGGATITGRVTEATGGRPIQGATVFVAGTQRGAMTRADGTYRMTVDAGRVELRGRATRRRWWLRDRAE